MADDLPRLPIHTKQTRPGGPVDTDAPEDRIFDPNAAARSPGSI